MRRVLAKVSLLLLMCCAVVLGHAVPATADETPAWEPGPEWGPVEYTELPEWAGATGCRIGEQWTWTAEQGQIVWQIVPCEDSGAAIGAGMWAEPSGRELGDASVLDHSDDQVWWAPTDQQVVRQWSMDQAPERENILVRVSVTCSSDAAAQCAEETAWVSAEIATAMPGSPRDSRFDLSLVFLLAFVGPGMLWALLVLPWRLILVLIRPTYSIVDHPPRVQDLTGAVRWARVRRFIRRIAWGLALAGLLLGLALALTGTSDQAVGITVIAGLLVGLLALAYKFAPPHPVERGRSIGLSRSGWRGILGVALSSVAYALLPVLLAGYLLVLAYDEIMPGWPVTTADELTRRPEPLAGLFYGWVTSAGSASLTFIFLALLPGLVVLFAVDLLGQRLRAATVADALARDRRPHYLYLRSFDEDTLKMPGLLRRRGLIGALTVFRKVRFEEVLVRQLSMTGPVIAIAPPGAKLPPIGAARASFSNDEWQAHVEHYARTARAVVLSATPREVRAGFGWEIDLVANRMGHGRVMVVLGPWSRTQLVNRWRQFCQAVAHLPLFAPMAMTWVPPGVQLLAHSDRQGWRAWGARSRTDWTYTMAVDRATREYWPDWS